MTDHSPPLVYLETSVFLGLLNNEPDKHLACLAAFTDAENRRIRATTSAATIAEVIKLKGTSGYIPPQDEARIDAFFHQPWLIVSWVDRRVAVEARRKAREHGLKPMDAIHVAAATSYGAKKLFTYDPDILRIGNLIPGLMISHPTGQIPFQL